MKKIVGRLIVTFGVFIPYAHANQNEVDQALSKVNLAEVYCAVELSGTAAGFAALNSVPTGEKKRVIFSPDVDTKLAKFFNDTFPKLPDFSHGWFESKSGIIEGGPIVIAGVRKIVPEFMKKCAALEKDAGQCTTEKSAATIKECIKEQFSQKNFKVPPSL